MSGAARYEQLEPYFEELWKWYFSHNNGKNKMSLELLTNELSTQIQPNVTLLKDIAKFT